MGLPESCPLSRRAEWHAWPRAEIDFVSPNRRFAHRRPRVLQLTRSARARQISAASVVPGILPRKRRRRHVDVRQRFHDVCAGRQSQICGTTRGKVQSEIWRDVLGGGGGSLMLALAVTMNLRKGTARLRRVICGVSPQTSSDQFLLANGEKMV